MAFDPGWDEWLDWEERRYEEIDELLDNDEISPEEEGFMRVWLSS